MLFPVTSRTAPWMPFIPSMASSSVFHTPLKNPTVYPSTHGAFVVCALLFTGIQTIRQTATIPARHFTIFGIEIAPGI